MQNLQCPISIQQYPTILMAHGGGGRLMHQLIDKLIMSAFSNPHLDVRHDSTVLNISSPQIAFTTDSYVIQPLFFPGGDIGSLAVHGTVNDLAMSGARPQYISCAFILEEGLETQTLWRVVQSMRQAADAAGVQIVTGDTKVVEKGKGDGLFINTAGIGVISHALRIAPASVQPGDAVILSGDLGRHGIAIMASRQGLEFQTTIQSDSAPVAGPVLALIDAGIEIHCLRDLTRGGLASALNEIAEVAQVNIDIDEIAIPVNEQVQGACEILGFDPLHVANEGRFIVFVPAKQADRAVAVLQQHPVSADARVIGQVNEVSIAPVTLKSRIGTRRIMDMLSGEQLPRIC
ncbi:MAG: hydrogenase expression/formation protein HypE [Phycisphaerales bacterium]|nr:hydrogenase expression/formation protein HypE [Phycisphaerales bacterium]